MSKLLILNEYIIIIVAGIIVCFSFAPYNLYFLSFISVILLLHAVENTALTSAALRTYVYGLSLYGIGCMHIYTLLANFVHDKYVALLMYVSLVAFLAIYPCLKICIYKCYKGSSLNKVVIFSSVWIVVDWVQERVFTGFPYLNFGYSLTDTELAAFAPVTSVYGLSWIIVFISGLIYFACKRYRQEPNIVKRFTALVCFIMLLAIVTDTITWTSPNKISEELMLVQGNISNKDYWNPKSYQEKITVYETLTHNGWDNKTIIWPENSITLPSNYAQDLLNKWSTTAQSYGSTLILGIPKAVSSDQFLTRNFFYNQALALGVGSGYYYKNKLVPWAEYIPWGTLGQSLADKIHIPHANMFSDVEDETTSNVLSSKYIKWVPFICYEMYFPSYVINRAQNGDVLLNLVNDSWFGDTEGLLINLQIAQMRALETGRPVVRVSNNGITAIISPRGEIIEQLPIFTRAVLNTKIFGYNGITPIMYYGTEGIIFLCSLIILLMFLQSIKSRYKQALINQYI